MFCYSLLFLQCRKPKVFEAFPSYQSLLASVMFQRSGGSAVVAGAQVSRPWLSCNSYRYAIGAIVSITFYIVCKARTVVRVRVRRSVIRIRISESAIRVRIVVRPTNDAAGIETVCPFRFRGARGLCSPRRSAFFRCFVSSSWRFIRYSLFLQQG